MATKKGMDISVFQGDISWGKVTGIDFALIRAGYGSNNIDSKALRNIQGCKDRKIPFGLYWFSYALSVSDATKEADYVCNIADKYKLTFPVIGYDWEYDSDNYAAKRGVSMSNDKRYQFALAFLKRVKQRGYIPVVYTNYDYLNKGFKALASAYDVWFAYPSGSSKPSITNLTIWQYSWKGKVTGINADVDMNYCYKEYAASAATPAPAATDTKASTYTPEAVASLALAEVGYREKASNSQLDSKTANAGSANWNKYAAYIDQHCPDFYNGKKNGFDWCDIFHDYLHIVAAGDAEIARKALYQPKKSTGAGCSYSAQFYRDNSAFIERGKGAPKVGDQIFFGTKGNEYHTGTVVGVDSNYVYTVEGNSSEMVAKRQYSLTDTKIGGYGRPNYTGKSSGTAVLPAVAPTKTTAAPDVTYKVRVGGKWLPEVKNFTDFAGIVGKPIADVAIKVSKGSVKYRVHVKGGGWLSWITKYDTSDLMGYAGISSQIDAIEIYYYTPSDVAKAQGYYKAKYRVSPVKGGYYSYQYDNEKTGGQDGYAGYFGKSIDRLQIALSK